MLKFEHYLMYHYYEAVPLLYYYHTRIELLVNLRDSSFAAERL